MDFRVEIKDPAIADLAEIVSYIAQDNPNAATALGNNLLDAALSLAPTPYKGSRYQKLVDIRKLTLRPFKIFYRVNETKKTVEILRFWHSAPSEPDLLTSDLNSHSSRPPARKWSRRGASDIDGLSRKAEMSGSE